jgi:hypothetical protein
LGGPAVMEAGPLAKTVRNAVGKCSSKMVAVIVCCSRVLGAPLYQSDNRHNHGVKVKHLPLIIILLPRHRWAPLCCHLTVHIVFGGGKLQQYRVTSAWMR